MKPLEDLRIIAVEQYGAGPFGTSHFAELGAEVVKIENPASGGDVGRYIPPYLQHEDSLYFQSLNRNKKSISLDLQSVAGRQVFHDLVRRADAVYCNFRGDGPEKMGLRYEDLKDVNPRIVCCSLSGYGQTGPRRAQASYDYAVQALSGWMSVTGEPDGPPTKTGLSLVDWSGGYVAALSMMFGIHAARRGGVGMDCDVSLFDVAMSFLTYYATWQQTAGYKPGRTPLSAHSSIVPFQNFETSDSWIAVCCPNQQFWVKYAAAIGRSDLLADPRYSDFEGRGANRETLLGELSAEMKKRTTADWVKLLEDADVPAAPVNTVAEALAEPQTVARNMVVSVDHPLYGTVTGVRSGVRVGDQNEDIRRGPSLNEHGQELMTQLLGYSSERIAELGGAGAFGSIKEDAPHPAAKFSGAA